MSFDSNLGQLLDGKQLPTIPPNASNDVQVSVLNDIINKLNNNSQEVVGSATVGCLVSGSAQDVFHFAHNLGYKPQAYAYIDNVTFTVGTLVFSKVNIPLPTYVGSNIIGGGGGGGLSSVVFDSWLDYFVDATNIYFHFNNPNGSLTGSSLPITYYLYRNPAN